MPPESLAVSQVVFSHTYTTGPVRVVMDSSIVTVKLRVVQGHVKKNTAVGFSPERGGEVGGQTFKSLVAFMSL